MAGTTVNPYRFGGQVGYRRDSATRQYVRARHLDTAKGRWVSRDPISFESGDSNLYRYSANTPVNIADPSGLLHIIGKLPPGVTPGGILQGNPGSNADTFCNFSTGTPVTVDFDRTCAAPCTDAHEAQHRYDLASCCAKAGRAFKALGGNPIALQKFLQTYKKWLDSNRNRTECQAYRAGRNCRFELYAQHGCSQQKATGDCDLCCSTLIIQIGNDYDQISHFCKKTDDAPGSGWPRGPQTPCPF